MKLSNVFKREEKAAGLDSKSERLICTGLVVSDRVCRELSLVPGAADLFIADFTAWVLRTALEHYRKHKRAPGRDIEHAFHLARREGKLRPDAASLVSEFLGGLSDEYERAGHFNEGYVIQDVALPYFRARALREASGDVAALLDAGRLDDAEQRWANYRSAEVPAAQGHDIFEDRDLHRRAFAAVEHPLFTLPGAIGELLEPQLLRTNFISLIGVVGRGKSFFLAELAKYAARARCNVLMIGVGDMSAEDYVLRVSCNLAGRSNRSRDCSEKWVPCVDCEQNQDNSCRLPQRTGRRGLPSDLLNQKDAPDPSQAPRDYRPCSACQNLRRFKGVIWRRLRPEVSPLTEAEGWEAMGIFRRRLKGKRFRLAVYPSKAITPQKLNTELERLRDSEGWLPDVIIADYMDEFGSDMKAGEQFRHREADKWSAMRGIMMRWNCLGIVAEQSDAAGYGKKTLGMGNFNEDRRRNDVVTGKLGYNRTTEDEALGIARLAWADKIRNASFRPGDQVVVAQDLSCARPLLGSWWSRRKKVEKE